MNLNSDKVVLICVDCEGTKENILRLFDVIKNEKIKVTFFVVGKTIEEYPDLFRELARGYQIESHTYSHINLRKLSKDDQKKEIIKGKETVEQVIGRKTHGFKAPKHCINKSTVEILNELNFKFDISSLYFKYDMKKVVKLTPSWFREWCSLYDFLHLSPDVPWLIIKLLFQIKNVLIISVHPQYSGKSDMMTEAFKNFIQYIKKRNAQIMDINEYLKTMN